MNEPARSADVLSLEAARDAKALGVSLPTSSVTPRAFTPRDVTTPRDRTPKGDSFLRSLPYSIADVLRYAGAAGYELGVRPGEKPPAALYAWKVRLAVENRRAHPAPVDAAEFPAAADPITAAVWNGFVFLIGCKRLWSPALCSTYTREFAAPWSGVSVRQAREAITVLSRMGYLIDTGERAGRATIWLPRGAER